MRFTVQFVRKFVRENPLLIGIYVFAACYFLVHGVVRSVLPATPEVTFETSKSETLVLESIKTVVATQKDLEKARNDINIKSNNVQEDLEKSRSIHKTLDGDGVANSSSKNVNIIPPTLLKDMSQHLEDYSRQISMPFLKNYLNPCWMESLADYRNLYKHNDFIARTAEASAILKTLLSFEVHTYAPRFKNGERWRLRCLPYFYIIGMAKCGTTDLWDLIASHPQVYPGIKKEYHWWSRARIDTNTPIQEYVSMFDMAAEKIRTTCPKISATGTVQNYCVTGEATVSTFWHCKKFDTNADGLHIPPDPANMTPGLMHRLQPDAKLILILRDPITRLYSDYVFFSTSKASLSAKDFHRRCEQAIVIMQNCFKIHDLRTCVHSADLHTQLPIEIFKSIYVVFLRDWLAVFPREQLLILHMETYSQKRAETMETVFNFLQLDPMNENLRQRISSKPVANSVKKYYSSTTGPMLEKTIAMLKQFFRPFNDQLVELIGDERYRWL